MGHKNILQKIIKQFVNIDKFYDIHMYIYVYLNKYTYIYTYTTNTNP